jgi:hypothetical protein
MFHLQLFFGEEREKLNFIHQGKEGKEELSFSFVLKNLIFFSSKKVAFIC